MVSKNSAPLVLIADDDPDDRLMIQEAFEECCPSCQVWFVHDGEELTKFLADRTKATSGVCPPGLPDLLLLDLNMPLKDGRESLSELRGDARFSAMPMVVMTTSRNEEDRRFCEVNGAEAYIVKPSRYSDLLDTVTTLTAHFLRNPDSEHG